MSIRGSRLGNFSARDDLISIVYDTPWTVLPTQATGKSFSFKKLAMAAARPLGAVASGKPIKRSPSNDGSQGLEKSRWSFWRFVWDPVMAGGSLEGSGRGSRTGVCRSLVGSRGDRQ